MHLKESDKALKHGGYSKISLPFQQSSTSHVKPQNHHNVWFNPSYSSGVITNVAKRFLQLLDLHFPPSNKFHKIFNRNNVKVKKKKNWMSGNEWDSTASRLEPLQEVYFLPLSYCCTQDVGNIIKSRNKELINSSNHHAQPWKCRKNKDCLLEAKCRNENNLCIISTSGHPDRAYLGTWEEDFLKRYYNHISSFKNKTQMNKTTLAKYIWEPRQKHNVTLEWSIVTPVPFYSNITKSCLHVMLHEKFEILTNSNQNELLNKEPELVYIPPC